MQNIPDWMPFACLLTGKLIPQKAMWTRVIEGALIACIGTGLTLFVGLPMAIERVQAKVDLTASTMADHIQWAKDHVAARDTQFSQERTLVMSHDAEILAQIKETNSRLDKLYNCVAVRSCTK